MNIVSFLLGALCGVLIIVVIASVSAYKQAKLQQELKTLVMNDLVKVDEKPTTKKTTAKKTTKAKKGE